MESNLVLFYCTLRGIQYSDDETHEKDPDKENLIVSLPEININEQVAQIETCPPEESQKPAYIIQNSPPVATEETQISNMQFKINVPQSNEFPQYLAPQYLPVNPLALSAPLEAFERSNFEGIPFNSAPNEPITGYRYVSRRKECRGSKLFEDMFSRADKSDDGALSFEEFQSFFKDEILSDEELLCLFNNMDINGNGHIELSELIEYFREPFEPYKELFQKLETSNASLGNCLRESYDYCKSSDDKNSELCTRIYLKEFLHRIDLMKESVSYALDTMITNSHPPEFPTREEFEFTMPEPDGIDLRKSGPINLTKSGNFSASNLIHHVNRLAAVAEEVSKYSPAILKQVNQCSFEIENEAEETYLLLIQSYSIMPEMLNQFSNITKVYMENTMQEPGNLHLFITRSELSIVVREVWKNKASLALHWRSLSYRQYQKELIDCVMSPPEVHTMDLPCSWFLSHIDQLNS